MTDGGGGPKGIGGSREWFICYWRTVEECPIEQGTRVERCGARRGAASQGVDMAVGDVSINKWLRNWTVNLGIPSTEQRGGSPMRSGSALHRVIRPMEFIYLVEFLFMSTACAVRGSLIVVLAILLMGKGGRYYCTSRRQADNILAEVGG